MSVCERMMIAPSFNSIRNWQNIMSIMQSSIFQGVYFVADEVFIMKFQKQYPQYFGVTKFLIIYILANAKDLGLMNALSLILYIETSLIRHLMC